MPHTWSRGLARAYTLPCDAYMYCYFTTTYQSSYPPGGGAAAGTGSGPGAGTTLPFKFTKYRPEPDRSAGTNAIADHDGCAAHSAYSLLLPLAVVVQAM